LAKASAATREIQQQTQVLQLTGAQCLKYNSRTATSRHNLHGP